MLTVFPKRHTLLQLSEAGKQTIWANRETICPCAEIWASRWDDFADIPVITRRWDETAGWISVGMSLPLRTGNNRWRMASHISPSAVTGIITPEQAAERSLTLDHPCGAVLRTAAAPAREFGIRLGVFGSTALAGITGLPYLHENSDLDLVLEATSEHGLREFATLLQNLEKNIEFILIRKSH